MMSKLHAIAHVDMMQVATYGAPTSGMGQSASTMHSAPDVPPVLSLSDVDPASPVEEVVAGGASAVVALADPPLDPVLSSVDNSPDDVSLADPPDDPPDSSPVFVIKMQPQLASATIAISSLTLFPFAY